MQNEDSLTLPGQDKDRGIEIRLSRRGNRLRRIICICPERFLIRQVPSDYPLANKYPTNPHLKIVLKCNDYWLEYAQGGRVISDFPFDL